MAEKIPFVEIGSRNKEGQFQVEARCTLRNNRVEIDCSDPSLLEDLQNGVYDNFGNLVTPDQGAIFLSTLQAEYKDPYLLATGVRYKDEEPDEIERMKRGSEKRA